MTLSQYRRDRLRFAALAARAGVRSLEEASEREDPAEALAAAEGLLRRAAEEARKGWRDCDRDEARARAQPVVTMPRRVKVGKPRAS